MRAPPPPPAPERGYDTDEMEEAEVIHEILTGPQAITALHIEQRRLERGVKRNQRTTRTTSK
jgi:hypothetical protein